MNTFDLGKRAFGVRVAGESDERSQYMGQATTKHRAYKTSGILIIITISFLPKSIYLSIFLVYYIN